MYSKNIGTAFTFFLANWDGFHDNETGIHGYTWSIGYDVCNDDVSMHIDPHAHLFDESEWNHQGLVADVNLPGLSVTAGFAISHPGALGEV